MRTLRKSVPGPQYAYTLSSCGIPFGSDDSENQRILRNLLLFEAYGYDVFGRKIDSDTGENDGPVKPSRYALYLNDSYGTSTFRLQNGLRYELFYTDFAHFVKPILNGTDV